MSRGPEWYDLPMDEKGHGQWNGSIGWYLCGALRGSRARVEMSQSSRGHYKVNVMSRKIKRGISIIIIVIIVCVLLYLVRTRVMPGIEYKCCREACGSCVISNAR